MSQPSIDPEDSNGVDALWHRRSVSGAPETYLVLLQNARIAKLAAGALEERLAAEDRRGLALVPPVRGTGFAEWVASPAPADRQLLGAWCTGNVPQGAAPVLVGLDEDGLADWLRRLGLAAYIGVPPCTGAPAGLVVRPGGEGRRDDAGRPADRVRLVPVSTAQELVEAVATATSPSGLTKAACPSAAAAAESAPTTSVAPVWLPSRRSRPEGQPALRHLVFSAPALAGASGLAGALVLAGLSPAAAASAQTSSADSALQPGSSLSGHRPGPGQMSLSALTAMPNPRGRHHRRGANYNVLPVNSINPGGPMIPAVSPGGPLTGGISARGRHRHHRGLNPGGPLAGLNSGPSVGLNPGGPPVETRSCGPACAREVNVLTSLTNDLAAPLGRTVIQAVDAIAQIGNATDSQIGSTIAQADNAAAAQISSTVAQADNAIGQMGSAALNHVDSTVAQVSSQTGGQMGSTIGQIGNAVSPLPAASPPTAGSTGATGGQIGGAIAQIGSAIGGQIGGAGGQIGGALGQIGGAIAQVGGTIGGQSSNAGGGGQIGNAIGQIGGAIAQIGNVVSSPPTVSPPPTGGSTGGAVGGLQGLAVNAGIGG